MYTKSFSKLLDRFGSLQIDKINICREPLSKAIMTLLNVSSRNQFEKNLNKTPYDKLYHLFIEIHIDNRIYILEKNDVLSLTQNSSNARSDTLEISIGNSLTLEDMLNKTKQVMGDKFFTYKAQDNNCQYFAQSFLTANGLGSKETEEFIMQDVSSLFDQDVKFRKLVNTITGIGKQISENKVVQKITPQLKQVIPIYNGMANLFQKIKF